MVRVSGEGIVSSLIESADDLPLPDRCTAAVSGKAVGWADPDFGGAGAAHLVVVRKSCNIGSKVGHLHKFLSPKELFTLSGHTLGSWHNICGASWSRDAQARAILGLSGEPGYARC